MHAAFRLTRIVQDGMCSGSTLDRPDMTLPLTRANFRGVCHTANCFSACVMHDLHSCYMHIILSYFFGINYDSPLPRLHTTVRETTKLTCTLSFPFLHQDGTTSNNDTSSGDDGTETETGKVPFSLGSSVGACRTGSTTT